MKNKDRLMVLKSLNIPVLTTKDLKNANLSSYDIASLIKSGDIISVQRGRYKLTNKELQDNAYNYNYELFYNYIIDKDFINSIPYLTKLYELTTNEKTLKELNLYTYLLNFIVDLPEVLSKSGNNDILVSEELKDIIILLRNHKFHQALNQIQQLEDKDCLLTICTTILETLTVKITTITKTVRAFVINDDLKAAQELLNKNVDIIYNNMKIQLRLINIILSGNIPSLNYNSYSNNFTEAINNNDFAAALKYHLNYIPEESKDTDTTYLLLEKINTMLASAKAKTFQEKNLPTMSRKELLKQQRIEAARKVSNSSDVKDEHTDSLLISKEVPSKEELQVLVMEESKVDILNILTKLMTNNSGFATMLLKNYLKEINKEEYEFLIADLIKISYLENDCAFLKPISTLAFISRDNFNFNIGEYIEEFYMNLANNNFQITYLYLDIIENAKNIGINFAFTDNLRIILKESKEKYENEYGDLKKCQVKN